MDTLEETETWIEPLSGIERTIKDLKSGQHVALRLRADQANWDIDEGTIIGGLDLVDDAGTVYQKQYQLPPLLLNIALGTVVSVSKDRIRIHPYSDKERVERLEKFRPPNLSERYLDLPFNRTGQDLAYVELYSLDFGKPPEH